MFPPIMQNFRGARNSLTQDICAGRVAMFGPPRPAPPPPPPPPPAWVLRRRRVKRWFQVPPRLVLRVCQRGYRRTLAAIRAVWAFLALYSARILIAVVLALLFGDPLLHVLATRVQVVWVTLRPLLVLVRLLDPPPTQLQRFLAWLIVLWGSVRRVAVRVGFLQPLPVPLTFRERVWRQVAEFTWHSPA